MYLSLADKHPFFFLVVFPPHFQRQKRQSGDSKKEMFELGDRLNVKLQNAKRAKEAEIGNFTCMLRECGVIDSNNRLVSPEAIIRKMRDIPINGDDTDGWLRAKLEEGVRTCHEFATAVPQVNNTLFPIRYLNVKHFLFDLSPCLTRARTAPSWPR